MTLAKRIAGLAALLLLFCGHAQAFWIDGTCQATRLSASGATSYSTSLPTGTINSVDTYVMFAVSQNSSDLSVSTSGWTIVTPSTGGDSGNNLTWNTSGEGKVAVFTASYGASAPAITMSSNSAYVSYISCAYYGVSSTTPVTAMAGTTTSSSATVNFPSVTPSYANEELLLYSAATAGASPTVSGTSTLTTGTNCTDGGTASNQAFVASVTTATPDAWAYRLNQGPCSPAATSSATQTISTSANSIGVSVLLKSVAFAAQKHPQLSAGIPLYYRDRGVYALVPITAIGSWDTSATGRSYLDGITAQERWATLQPTCTSPASYTWDDLDNRIINGEVKGLNIELEILTGDETPCGGAGETSCSSPEWSTNTNTPDWVRSSNSCGGSGAKYISSFWTDSAFGPPIPNVNYIFDQGDTNYLTPWANMMTAVGQRYNGNVPNISAVAVPQGREGLEMEINTGADSSTINCGGSATATDCNAMSGYGDYLTSHTYSANFIILPTASNTHLDYFKTTSGGTTSTSEPNWDSACTMSCTDTGGVTWTNEGVWNVAITDASQWTSAGFSLSGNSCTSGGNTLCYAFLTGTETMESDIHTAFQHALISLQGYSSGGLSTSEYSSKVSGPCSAFSQPTNDPWSIAVQNYDASTYQGILREQNDSMGVASGGTSVSVNANLPYCEQPKMQVGFQTKSGQSSVGGGTNCQTAPLYSISTTNCVPPMVYGSAAVMQFPYWEDYLTDLDTAASQPWLLLQHQLAWGN